MRFYVITIFPGLFPGPLAAGVTGKAIEAGKVEIIPVDLRDFAHDRHRTVDDIPYGGGPGMVMKPEPLFEAVESIREEAGKRVPVVFLTPKGKPFAQSDARALCEENDSWILVCGRYRGVDERFRETLVDREYSIGDFVMSGGEIPAHAIMDAAIRLLPGVLGNDESTGKDSFSRSGLDGVYYTRPQEYRGLTVPDVLLSGHHSEIGKWRESRSRAETERVRPDLVEGREEPAGD